MTEQNNKLAKITSLFSELRKTACNFGEASANTEKQCTEKYFEDEIVKMDKLENQIFAEIIKLFVNN